MFFRRVLVVISLVALTRANPPLPTIAAGMPVNYDEAKVGAYSLTDPLQFGDDMPVRNAELWGESAVPRSFIP